MTDVPVASKPTLPPPAPTCGGDAWAGVRWLNRVLQLPFDALRAQHAEAVHAGVLPNSILESRRFECTLDAMEHLTLGPFARHV